MPYVSATTYLGDDDFLQGNITWINQDSKGYIWISTFNGLNRFDGYRWIRYKSDTGVNSILHTNRINITWENSRGDLWCNANGKLYLFNTENGTFTNVQERLDQLSIKSANVLSGYTLANGYSWLIGESGECFRVSDDDPLDKSEIIAFQFTARNQIFNVFLDETGQEWILTSKGAFIYGNGQPQPVSKMPLRYVEPLENGLWFTSANGFNVAWYDYDTRQINYKDFIPDNGYVYRQTRDGNLLYTATSGGIWCTDIISRTSSPLSDYVCEVLFADSRHRLWGKTADGQIVMRSGEMFQTVPLPDGFSYSDKRVQFHEDRDGTVWFLPFDSNEILYFDGYSFVSPATNLQGQSRKAKGYFVDRQGNIWYHLEKRADMLTINTLPAEANIIFPGKEVRSQLFDSYGNHWYGLLTNTLVVIFQDGRRQEFTVEGVPYCIFEDSRHRFWVGSKEGGLYLLSLNGNTFKIERRYTHQDNLLQSLSSDNIYSIIEDSKGYFWIGTFGGGINLFDPEKEIFYHQGYHFAYDSDLPVAVRLIREVRPGIVMVASREGFFTFRNDFSHPEEIHMVHNLKRPHDVTSLPDNDIMDILVSRIDSSIWLSTISGGICQIVSDDLMSDHVACRSITKTDGLASDVCYSLLEDGWNNLWVTGGRSLSKILHGKNGERDTVIVYDLSQYGTPVSFSEGIPLNLDSVMVFGTTDGTLSLRPLDLTEDSYVPPLVTEIEYQSPSHREVTIRFAAIDFRKKSYLKYAYRMDGIDTDWKTTTDNSVTYINLPPGNNHFHIRSTKANGIWTNNDTTLELYVPPTFFETIVGHIVIVLLAIALLTAILLIARHYYRLKHRLTVEKEMTDMRMRFLTDVGHELRTPLTLVDGPVSEVLEDKTLSDQSRYYLEVVQKNVRRMLNLVNQILDAHKIENRKMKLLLEHIDLNVFCEHVMDNFRELAAQHSIRFILEAPMESMSVWADRDKVEKILFNLLSNAFKYTSDGKMVAIRIKEDHTHITVSVADEGIGIRKEDIPNLFRRFDTILASNVFKPSSGIGLSLVKQYSDLHHATVSVESEPGKGSTFTVSFQKGKKHFEGDEVAEFYVADMDRHPSDPSQNDDSVETAENESQQPTILLVEDNEELRDFMVHILESTYRVITATNGEEGLSKGKEFWPDLIVTDLMMPKMDGFEMISHIKADPDIYYIPIIVLTAKDSMDDRIKGVGMGVDDYVMKPFSASYIKTRVAALIQQRRMLKNRYLEMVSQDNNGLALSSLEPTLPKITPADELFVQEAMAFMENNMDNSEISIDDFADAMKMGRTMFANKLKATLGVTPIDFVQQIRIKRAVQLIGSKQYNIAEVAYMTGFNDPKYFSRCFKKHIGSSPSDYLKNQSN